jgi:hypothetical protein
MGIEVTLEPEIWYTCCNYYTPDLLVKNELIVEVDGPYHDDPRNQVNDRIRQRALENSGYPIFRFKNQEIHNSLGVVISKIKHFLSQPRQLDELNPRIIEIDVPEAERMSNISEDFVKAYAMALNSTVTTIEKWNTTHFMQFLSQYNPTPLRNRCAMQKLFYVMLGLNLSTKNEEGYEPIIDFEHYSNLFDKSIGIMSVLFGKIAELEIRNAYNITVTNFIKNLIFYGKPRIMNNRIVLIKDYHGIISHINDFNKYFSRFGISVQESDVKVECQGELDKIKRHLDEKKQVKRLIDTGRLPYSELERFRWLDRWLEEAKGFSWLEEWMGQNAELA